MDIFSKAITVIVSGAFILLGLLVAGIGGCEARKAYYDWEVRRLCEKDGGATIYEHIEISPAMAASMGRVGGHLSIADESVARPDSLAFLRADPPRESIGDLSVHRYQESIVRRSDGKVVARIVRYARSGGDFPFSVSNASTFSCPAFDVYYADISKVFRMKEVSK